jgi:hypothetical protein
VDDPVPLKILKLRAEICELGGAIRQLQRSGMDSAAAQLLITRKRGELEWLISNGLTRTAETTRHS